MSTTLQELHLEIDLKFNLFSAQVNFFRFSRKIVCLKMSTSTEEVVNKPREPSEREYSEQNDFVKWRKAKKVALMASFVGKDYLDILSTFQKKVR